MENLFTILKYTQKSFGIVQDVWKSIYHHKKKTICAFQKHKKELLSTWLAYLGLTLGCHLLNSNFHIAQNFWSNDLQSVTVSQTTVQFNKKPHHGQLQKKLHSTAMKTDFYIILENSLH